MSSRWLVQLAYKQIEQKGKSWKVYLKSQKLYRHQNMVAKKKIRTGLELDVPARSSPPAFVTESHRHPMLQWPQNYA